MALFICFYALCGVVGLLVLAAVWQMCQCGHPGCHQVVEIFRKDKQTWYCRTHYREV